MNLGNITPHILLEKRNRPLGWNAAIGELIDNSFDADASRVVIDIGKSKQLSVEDDGNGCSDISRMLTIADHNPHATTKLGRYGVGLKDAGCWLWGELRIRSVYKGKGMSAAVNWDRLSKQSDWNVADPEYYTPQEDFLQGTRLQFIRHSRNTPNLEKLSKDLGYMFWPGLSGGRQIVLLGKRKCRVVCKAWSPPPLTDVIEDEFAVDGKLVALKAGIVPADDTNERFGFNFAYGHRNITNSSLGSNGNSVSRICGIVTLGEGWTLGTNKTEICDDQDSLGDAIWERCQGIIEKSKTQAESIYNRELEDSVSEAIQDFLTGAKQRAKRDKGGSKGAVLPKDTERKVRRAKKKQDGPGDILAKIRAGKFRMEWRPRDDGRLGHADLPGMAVYLNCNHSRLSLHRDAGNKEAIVDSCLTLFCDEVLRAGQGKQKQFAFSRESNTFIDALSSLTNSSCVKEPV